MDKKFQNISPSVMFNINRNDYQFQTEHGRVRNYTRVSSQLYAGGTQLYAKKWCIQYATLRTCTYSFVVKGVLLENEDQLLTNMTIHQSYTNSCAALALSRKWASLIVTLRHNTVHCS